MRCAFVDTARSLRSEGLKCEDLKRRGQIENYARKLEATSRIDSALREARAIKPICCYSADFDKDIWALNVLNGTINLKTGELRPHNPSDMICQLANVSYDQSAKCPTFDRFIHRIMNENAELVSYLHKFLGMCLSGDIREQVLNIFYGAGQNGKNTLLEGVMLGLMGDWGLWQNG